MLHSGARQPVADLCVESGPLAARSLLKGLTGGLKPLGLSIDEFSKIQLAVAEAINNIVEHAYANGALSGPISLLCSQTEDALFVMLSDTGKPMPDGNLPQGHAQNLNVDISDLPEGGFGWFLIRDLAEDVSYSREGEENHVLLRFQAPRP